MDYVAGVDGGNTKTVALIARLDGTVVGHGRGGCGDMYSLPRPTRAIPEVERAVADALAQAGIGAEQLLAGAFSMAGGDWPEDLELLRSMMAAHGFGRNITVVNDALGALRAGSPDGTGVVIVCGTGAATGARSRDGRTWHSGFWQGVGGADHLGRKALDAVYRAELGLAAPTSLTERVLRFYGRTEVEDVLHLLTAREANQSHSVRHLAQVLLDEAAAGDAVAHRIVAAHGAALGDYAVAAAQRVGLDRTPFSLVLAGGVLRHPSPLLVDAIVAQVRARYPDVAAVNSTFEPAVGALLLALEAVGIVTDSALMARLRASLPPAEMWDTLEDGNSLKLET